MWRRFFTTSEKQLHHFRVAAGEKSEGAKAPQAFAPAPPKP
ncbi:hypothetical protein DAD186_03680 [Dermabacter vaginalis]|uniref:Uncharacterized protein n=1 Tax=Dermabacter vaginalis TaxID=1630135 RepID=A0A1B0ZG29_9MICO|nr:hypothetical protein DAD186_03680 [Dermabacter vaginalis]